MSRVDWTYAASVVLAAAMFCGLLVGEARTRFQQQWSQAAAAAEGIGEVRDVDVRHIKRLIEQGYLSDREAEFYEPVLSEPSGLRDEETP